ncbi:hypothetical protein OJF2_38770 [Aquisphaera giovannonii]|uniref:Uncharacterized protein n=1 Tax=Aquisphaera giovannonii TaxID=406548 RepID=A0A5B9W3Y1_9BACT|nr:hypothetical protein [Aquisphaera giovannonii]QEH35326.1 hypothetical protein OJF2_38770 [Aquisphaera giovannonii]
MWTIRDAEIESRRGLLVAVDRGGRPASFADVLGGWREDAAFRAWFNGVLAGLPFAAFRWETPAVTAATSSRAFEFVALDDPGLARRPAPDAFGDRFRAAGGEEVLAFPNLGRDAILVVPAPVAAPSAYGHLAAFVREAPERQRDELWRSVGEALAGRLGERPVWLSTAGAGVAWLHVRLDDRPKYYGYGPYRQGS